MFKDPVCIRASCSSGSACFGHRSSAFQVGDKPMAPKRKQMAASSSQAKRRGQSTGAQVARHGLAGKLSALLIRVGQKNEESVLEVAADQARWRPCHPPS